MSATRSGRPASPAELPCHEPAALPPCCSLHRRRCLRSREAHLEGESEQWNVLLCITGAVRAPVHAPGACLPPLHSHRPPAGRRLAGALACDPSSPSKLALPSAAAAPTRSTGTTISKRRAGAAARWTVRGRPGSGLGACMQLRGLHALATEQPPRGAASIVRGRPTPALSPSSPPLPPRDTGCKAFTRLMPSGDPEVPRWCVGTAGLGLACVACAAGAAPPAACLAGLPAQPPPPGCGLPAAARTPASGASPSPSLWTGPPQSLASRHTACPSPHLSPLPPAPPLLPPPPTPQQVHHLQGGQVGWAPRLLRPHQPARDRQHGAPHWPLACLCLGLGWPLAGLAWAGVRLAWPCSVRRGLPLACVSSQIVAAGLQRSACTHWPTHTPGGH